MKYIKLYEELYTPNSVEKYAKIISDNIKSYEGTYLLIYVHPEPDFPIRNIRILINKDFPVNAFDKARSNKDSITIQFKSNKAKLSLIIHELIHAYQFIQLLHKGKKLNGHLGEFVGGALQLSDNKDFYFLLMGLYLSIPTETAAHLAEFNYTENNIIEKWLKWYKTIDSTLLYKSISSIEDIDELIPDIFIKHYKDYCIDNDIQPDRKILKIKSLKEFVNWSLGVFYRFHKKLERKMLKIKYSKISSASKS